MMISRTLVVFAGTVCLFFGLVLPFATVPIVGSVTVLGYSLTYSALLLIAIVAAWLLAYLKAFRLERDLGGLLVVIFVGVVIYFEYTMHQRMDALSQSLKGNPFAGLATAAMGTIHLDIGVAVLILGAVLLIVSSFVREAEAISTSEAEEAHKLGVFVGQQFHDNRPLAIGILGAAVVALAGAMYVDHQSAVTREAAQTAQAGDVTTTTPVVPSPLASEDSSTRQPTENSLNAVVSVQPLGKDFHQSDPTNGDYEDQIVLTLQYHNLGQKPLSAFKGLLELTNKFGDRIQGFQVDYEKRLDPGAIVTETTYYDYNQYEDADVSVRATPLSDMRFRWTPSKVLFADGHSMSSE
jgi:hypothetical protein